MTHIADFLNKVKANLQNRSDVTEAATNPEMRPSAWLRDAIREITASQPFAELQVTGPVVTIGPGLGWQGSNFAYPVSMFLNPGDDVTLTEDPAIFLASNQAAGLPIRPVPVQTINQMVSGNLVAYGMNFIKLKAFQSEIFIPGGVPYKYTRWNTQFFFGPQPGQQYLVYLPYQKRHPFHDSNLPSSLILMPRDWHDIIAYAAAERGAIALRWNDQANFIHTLLYGDPKSLNPNTGEYARLGLIAAKFMQEERDNRLSTVQILPGAQRY